MLNFENFAKNLEIKNFDAKYILVVYLITR